MENDKEIIEEKDNELPPSENEEKKDDVQALFNDYVMKLPESEKDQEKVILEPNKPAYWSQRIAAGLIDICLLFLACWGLFELFVMSPMGDGLREERNAMQEVIDYYKLQPLVADSSETVGYKLYFDEEGYDKVEYQDYLVYTDPDNNKEYKVVDYPESTEAALTAYKNAVAENTKYQNAVFNYRIKNFGLVFFAGAISEVVFIVVVPLLNKDRATIGKLAAGLKVINVKYQVEARWYQMVGRFLWTLSIESALPVLFLPSIGSFTSLMFTVTLVPVILFLITLTNKDRRTLHDFVARTRVIDKRSFVPLNEQ